MTGAYHFLTKKLAQIAILPLALFGFMSSAQVAAQDLQYSNASELIYPPFEKIILPYETASFKMEKDRKFLYLEETKELDRLITHMNVKKDMTVEIISKCNDKNNEMAHARNKIIKGYLADNGADLKRISFIAMKDDSSGVDIRALNDA